MNAIYNTGAVVSGVDESFATFTRVTTDKVNTRRVDTTIVIARHTLVLVYNTRTCGNAAYCDITALCVGVIMQDRDRPELIFTNSAETETGPNLIIQFRPKTKLRPNLSPGFGRNRNRNRKSITQNVTRY